ncbi:MAG: di-trans,poly-cis-decaprenylcistransferase, partial [Deferribacteres bacterium]|nr:di-trans,poly-cis-decaprenylcistransferase [Deferribacteres bacterium]
MIDSGDLPAHVAIIMDGNGRWAKQRGMPRIEGHRVGIERAEEIIAASRELGIKYLTLFAFSTENWSRPEEEVSFLMSLLREYLEFKEKELVSQDIKFNVIGRISLLPKDVVSVVERVKKTTHRCGSMVLTLALSYGGRAEIVDATKKLALRLSAGDISVDDIDEELFSKFIYSPWIPDPDLLIRTGGELRISNFMLWELAYTELYFTETLWP